MNPLKNTELIAVIDRSGSMQSIRQSAQDGFNAFVRDQAAAPGQARVTLVQFDDTPETVYEAMPVRLAPPYTLAPRGSTALHDAIGRTMNEQGKRIAAQRWADLVILIIVTDGGENASREFTSASVKEMITHAEKHGWQVIYLGANQDAFTVADRMGIRLHNTANYAATAVGTHSAYASASSMTQSLRAGGASGQSLQSLVDGDGLAAGQPITLPVTLTTAK